MNLTHEQIGQVVAELRNVFTTHKINPKTKRGHMAECLYLRGVNAVLGVLSGRDAGAINLPPIMAVSLMTGRSILDEVKTPIETVTP